jgi:hypothetical protein
VTIHDAMAVDWIERKNLCPDELFAADLDPLAYAYHALLPLPQGPAEGISVAPAQTLSPASFGQIPGRFVVAAKRYEHRPGDIDDFLSDRLYGLGEDGLILSESVVPAQDRFNGKLVRGPSGALYQLNLERGLVRLGDDHTVVPPGSLRVEGEPRYGAPASIYVGLQGGDGDYWGRPLLDAAFDSHGYVYVVPVVVAPEANAPYVAAAQLRLDGAGLSPGYSIEQLFEDSPAPNDNRALTQLRELEVDPSGNLYVLNCHHLNQSDLLWVYTAGGQHTEPCELQSLGISAPTGLCLSSYDPSKLYLASSENPPDADSTRLYVLSSQGLNLLRTVGVRNMGHVTDIAEDPATGAICVVGFRMPTIPSESEIQDIAILHQLPFYQPRLAMISPGDNGPVEAVCPTGLLSPSDMALPLSVICATEGATQGRGEAP